MAPRPPRGDARDEAVRPTGFERGGSRAVSSWTLGIESWIWIGAWAFVMVLVVWLLVREPHHEPHDDPKTILRDRFARGEITEEEYAAAITVLDVDPQSAPASARHHAAHHAHQGQEARK